MSGTEIKLIEKDRDIASALDWLGNMDPVGADVEREDQGAYYLRAALIQIGGNGKVALFDPMSLKDWSLVADWLSKKCLVLHAMENDIFPLARLGLKPEMYEDTSLAAAFLGRERGLANLLKSVMGIEIELDKNSMQRSPWEHRPLTKEQIQYAAGDVADLPELFERLADELEDCGRWDWYTEELDYQLKQPLAFQKREWLGTKGVKSLNARAKTRAKAIWEWREKKAQNLDIVPNKILEDSLVVDLANEPITRKKFLRGRGMTKDMVAEYGEELLEIIKQPYEKMADDKRIRPKKPDTKQRKQIEVIRQKRSVLAQELDLDIGMLLPSKIISRGVMSNPTDAEEIKEAFQCRDWQWSVCKDILLDTMLG